MAAFARAGAAIHYAEFGFPVAARVASDWRALVGKLGNSPGAAKHYLPGGHAPEEGDIVKLPALAATLKAVAKDGPRAFYEGPIAGTWWQRSPRWARC